LSDSIASGVDTKSQKRQKSLNRELQLEARALRQRWPIDDRQRNAIIRTMLGIMLSGDAKPRDRISAGKALLAAEAQNQADEHKAVDVSLRTEHDRLDAIARDLGLEVGLIEAAEGQSRGGADGVEAVGIVSAD
jgi:hypothetical protein